MLTTKNIIVNPSLFPIIGESNKLVREISKRFTKYYKRGIKRENRNKLLGYNLFVPKSFSKFESCFREDLMMIEVKINKKSSILIPSFYTKTKTLRSLFELKNKKSIKSVYKLSNGTYKINMLALNEAVGSLGNPSITQKPGEEVSLGFATDVKEKSINTWLEAELGDIWYKKIAKGMTKGLNVIPGGGVISKGLDSVIDKVMSKGRFNKISPSLAVDSYGDGEQRMRAILAKLFEKSVDDQGKGEFINHACKIFSYDNVTPETVKSWGQGLMDIDANNLLQIEAKLNQLLLKDMKKFIKVSEGSIEGLGKKDYFFTIDKFKKKAHDVIDRILDKYEISKDSLSDKAKKTGTGTLKAFFRNAFKTIMITLLIGVILGQSLFNDFVDKSFAYVENKAVASAIENNPTGNIGGQEGIEIATSSQVADTSAELRGSSDIIDIPGIEACFDQIDEHAAEFVGLQKFVESHGEIDQDFMHDIFLIVIIDQMNTSTGFGKKISDAASKTKDGSRYLEAVKGDIEKAKQRINKKYSKNGNDAINELLKNPRLLEGMVKEAAQGWYKSMVSKGELTGEGGFDFDNLYQSNGKLNESGYAFNAIIQGIVASSKISEVTGLKYDATKTETFLKIFGLGNKKVTSETTKKLTNYYKKGLEEAKKEVIAIGEECIKELEEKGQLGDLDDQAKVAQEKIEKIAKNSFDTFSNWLAKFIPDSGRSSIIMKHYDNFIKKVYLAAYESFLQDAVKEKSESADAKLKALANDPRNATRLSSLLLMMLYGLKHKWSRRDEIGQIGAEILRQNKQKNRIFKSMYAMNAIKSAQAIAYCSTIAGLQDKDAELVEKMGILNGELSNLVSIFEGDAVSGQWIVAYKAQTANQSGGFSEDELDNLSFDQG